MTNYYSKESIKDRLNTQDNRMTQDPFFIVQEEFRDIGYDLDYSLDENIALFEWEDTECILFPGDEGYKRALQDSNYEHTGFVARWESVAYFFTEGAADEYIDKNRHRHEGVLRTYADSLYNNPEMKAVRAILMEGESESDPLEKYRLDLSSVEEEWNTLSPEAKERFRQIEASKWGWGTEYKLGVAHTVSSLDNPNAPGLGWKLSDKAKAEIKEIEDSQRRAWQMAPFIWAD